MKKLTEQKLESAFDLHTGEILEESLDATKLTDEELERVTGSQFFGSSPFFPSPFTPSFQTQSTNVFVSTSQFQSQFSPFGSPW
jgi:hypothetical protein